MKILNMFLLWAAVTYSLVEKGSESADAPVESKKMDIILPQTVVDPIVFRTNNVVKNVYSFNSPVKVYSRTGEVLKAKPKRSSASPIAESIPFIRKIKKNHPNHRYFQNYELRPSYYDPNERKLEEEQNDLEEENEIEELRDEMDIVPTDETALEEDANLSSTMNEDPNVQNELSNDANTLIKDPVEIINISDNENSAPFYGIGPQRQDLKKIFVTNEEYEAEHNEAMRIHVEHSYIAYKQVLDIENQIKDAINEAQTSNPKLMNPRVIKLLSNFMEHVNFLEKGKTSSQGIPVPKLYDYFLDKEITLDELEALNDKDVNGENELEQETVPDIRNSRGLKNKFSNNKINGRQNIQARVRKLRRIPIRSNYIRKNRRASNVGVMNPEDSNVKSHNQEIIRPMLPIPPQNVQVYNIPDFVAALDSLKHFYNTTFELLPERVSISGRDDTTIRNSLQSYHKIDHFKKIFFASISIFETDLNMLKSYMSALAINLHNLVHFYGYSSQYDKTESDTSEKFKAEVNDFKGKIDTQSKVFIDRVNTLLISINEIKSDISLTKDLINDIKLPNNDQTLFNLDFVETITYSNDKIPKVLGIGPTIYKHIDDLKTQFDELKNQKTEVDKLFTEHQVNISAIQNSTPIIALSSLLSFLLVVLFH